MTGQRAGSAKVPAGPWSMATAQAFDQLMKDKGFTREQISDRTGISDGRVSKLLNGGRAWYLEDVARFCQALDLAFIPFLRGLHLEAQEEDPEASVTPRGRKRMSGRPPRLADLELAADHETQDVGTETDEGHH